MTIRSEGDWKADRLERENRELDEALDQAVTMANDLGGEIVELERLARAFLTAYDLASLSDEEGLLPIIDPRAMRDLWDAVDAAADALRECLTAGEARVSQGGQPQGGPMTSKTKTKVRVIADNVAWYPKGGDVDPEYANEGDEIEVNDSELQRLRQNGQVEPERTDPPKGETGVA